MQAAYALQLALGALSGIVERSGAAAVPDVDVRAVLAAAQQADSALVRGAALALLGRLAGALPQAELESIVRVGSRVHGRRPDCISYIVITAWDSACCEIAWPGWSLHACTARTTFAR